MDSPENLEILQEEKDLREILSMLKDDFRKLSSAIDFNSENAKRLTVLLNARQKIAMSIFTGTTLLRDPKLKLATDTGKRRDLARMIQRALIKNNPAAKKMVGEAEKKLQEEAARTKGKAAIEGK